ncbi:MAG: hypothetical protein HY831_04770 [Candidatus Aenigmarchaeota archaeon]|nr:hypothetical protein [Candidatus Aenigmarchaeota archaeon]
MAEEQKIAGIYVIAVDDEPVPLKILTNVYSPRIEDGNFHQATCYEEALELLQKLDKENKYHPRFWIIDGLNGKWRDLAGDIEQVHGNDCIVIYSGDRGEEARVAGFKTLDKPSRVQPMIDALLDYRTDLQKRGLLNIEESV